MTTASTTPPARRPQIQLVWSQGIGLKTSLNPFGLHRELLNDGAGWPGVTKLFEQFLPPTLDRVRNELGLTVGKVVFRLPWGHEVGIQRMDQRAVTEARGFVRATNVAQVRETVRHVEGWLLKHAAGHRPVGAYVGSYSHQLRAGDSQTALMHARTMMAELTACGFEQVIFDMTGDRDWAPRLFEDLGGFDIERLCEPLPWNPAMARYGSWCTPQQWRDGQALMATLRQFESMLGPNGPGIGTNRVLFCTSVKQPTQEEIDCVQLGVQQGCDLAFGFNLWAGAADETIAGLRALGV